MAGSGGTVCLRWDDPFPGTRRLPILVAVLASDCGGASSPCGPEGQRLSAWPPQVKGREEPRGGQGRPGLCRTRAAGGITLSDGGA